ncbi:MAG: DNA recombination protein RmuC [Bacteroidota bacterium]
MELLLVSAGMLIGFFIGWLLFRPGKPANGATTNQVAIEIYKELNHRHQELLEKYTAVKVQAGRLEQHNQGLVAQLTRHKDEITSIQESFRIEFRNLTNDLLEEKSRKFVALNEQQLGNILLPLRERIEHFEKKVDAAYSDDNRERASMREHLKTLLTQTQQVGDDARKLANALKGDSKVQGDWGEVQLEMLLEKSGLIRDIHFLKQATYKDDDGNRYRPDYVITLPEDKQLIIDSKVSLTAYERYFNTDDELQRKSFLQDHLLSITGHINQLGAKNYHQLLHTTQPDYVILFVPLENALTLALREDSRLVEKALEKNIVLVSGSTLLATLRTIAFMWRQENQKQNVAEIARESGLLYDKFVGFITDLKKVGSSLDSAKQEYDNSLNKLFQSSRQGDTIVGRMERIRKLGAKTSKSLPISPPSIP